MKKNYLILVLTLCSLGGVLAQKTTKISLYTDLSGSITKMLETRNPAYSEYVQDRRRSNSLLSTGVALGITLERPLTESLSYRIGLGMATYGFGQDSWEEKTTTPTQVATNPNRISYTELRELYFVQVPIAIKKTLWDLTHSAKPKDCACECAFKSFFNIYAVGGISPSWTVQNDYRRTYTLEGGAREEITTNEFESNFGTNSFNLLAQAGLGIEMSGDPFRNLHVFVEPTIGHYLWSIYSSGVSERLSVFSVKLGMGITL